VLNAPVKSLYDRGAAGTVASRLRPETALPRLSGDRSRASFLVLRRARSCGRPGSPQARFGACPLEETD